MNKAKTAMIAIGIVLLIVIILQNIQPVETKILFMTFRMPRAVFIFVTLLIGFGFGLLLSDFVKKKLKMK